MSHSAEVKLHSGHKTLLGLFLAICGNLMSQSSKLGKNELTSHVENKAKNEISRKGSDFQFVKKCTMIAYTYDK